MLELVLKIAATVKPLQAFLALSANHVGKVDVLSRRSLFTQGAEIRHKSASVF